PSHGGRFHLVGASFTQSPARNHSLNAEPFAAVVSIADLIRMTVLVTHVAIEEELPGTRRLAHTTLQVFHRTIVVANNVVTSVLATATLVLATTGQHAEHQSQYS